MACTMMRSFRIESALQNYSFGNETNMHITLPPEAQAIIDREIKSGRYQNVEDVIVTALYQIRDIPYVDEDLLVNARTQADHGDVYEINDSLRSRVREEANADFENDAEIVDEIKY